MKNIMLPPALRSARKPMPTTAATARPYRRLTAVPNTGPTVQASAKPNTTTTAATGLRSFPPVRQTRPVLTSPTAPQKFRAGPVFPVISSREAPASWRIPAGHIINVTARISIVPERPVRRILQNAAFIVLTICIRTAALIVVCVVEGINISIAVLPVRHALVGEIILNLLTI